MFRLCSDNDTAPNIIATCTEASVGYIIKEGAGQRVLTWVDRHVVVHLVIGSPARDAVTRHALDFTRQTWTKQTKQNTTRVKCQ